MIDIKVGNRVVTKEGLLGTVKDVWEYEDYDGDSCQGKPIVLKYPIIYVEFEDGTQKILGTRDLKVV